MKTMDYLYFPGCRLETRLPGYDRSVRTVLAALDIGLCEAELNCCGYPVRDADFTASMLCGARVLALAARKKLPLLTPCKCCFGNLMHVHYWMRENSLLRLKINQLLSAEGLCWSENVAVHHLLSVLAEPATIGRMAERIRQPLSGLKVAAHYGCHALRPSDVTGFDNPLDPAVFEKVISACGAEPVRWPLRLECCGYPLEGKNDRLSLAMMHRKLKDARAAGARVLATACTYCQLQFEKANRQTPQPAPTEADIPALPVSHLAAFALGLAPAAPGPEYLYLCGQLPARRGGGKNRDAGKAFL